MMSFVHKDATVSRVKALCDSMKNLRLVDRSNTAHIILVTITITGIILKREITTTDLVRYILMRKLIFIVM